MPKYKLLVVWDQVHPEALDDYYDDYIDLVKEAKKIKSGHPGDHGFYYIQWEPGIAKSFWVSAFSSKELEKEDA
jgi:hypothetical protein